MLATSCWRCLVAKGDYHRNGIMVSTPQPIQVFNKPSIILSNSYGYTNGFLFGRPRHQLGYKVASVDYDYSEKHMNFLSTAGYLHLISIIIHHEKLNAEQ